MVNIYTTFSHDFVPTIPYIPNNQSALTFSRTKDFAGYTIDELEHLSAKAALPRRLVTDTAEETVAIFMERWVSEKLHLPMDGKVVETIDWHLGRLPIATGEA